MKNISDIYLEVYTSLVILIHFDAYTLYYFTVWIKHMYYMFKQFS